MASSGARAQGTEEGSQGAAPVPAPTTDSTDRFGPFPPVAPALGWNAHRGSAWNIRWVQAADVSKAEAPLVLMAGAGDRRGIVAHLRSMGLDAEAEADRARVSAALSEPDAKTRLTPMLAAAHAKRPEMVQWLIKAGAMPDVAGPDMCTPLAVVARKGLLSTLAMLFAAGADASAPAQNGMTPLHQAASKGEAEAVKFLLAKGVDRDAADLVGRTALMLAALEGHEYVVQALGAAGASLNLADSQGWTALHMAVAKERTSTVSRLLTLGASPRLVLALPDGSRWSPLMLAARSGNADIVRALLFHGAEPEYRAPPGGLTAEAVAVMFKHQRVVDLLVEATPVDAPPAAALIDPRTGAPRKPSFGVPLAVAMQDSGCTDMSRIMRMLSAGESPNLAPGLNLSPLQVAAFHGSFALTGVLLRHKAEVGPGARHGSGDMPPLAIAARLGYSAVATQLLEAGAPAGEPLPDGTGRTPLWLAASLGHAEVVERLLRFRGALESIDAPQVVGDRSTPLVAAVTAGHREVVQILLRGGASVALADARLRTPLMVAVEAGNADLVSDLLEPSKLTTLNLTDKMGMTPLAAAVVAGNADIVRMLLRAGADPNVGDVEGRTPLMWAAFHSPAPMSSPTPSKATTAAAISAATTTTRTTPAVATEATTSSTTAAEERESIFAMLLRAGANPLVVSQLGWTAVAAAVESANATVLAQVLAAYRERGADGTAVSLGHHMVPLAVVATKGQADLVSVLLSAGASVNSRTMDSDTPLLLAARRGHLRVSQMLVEAGAALSARNGKGRTVVMQAAAANRARLVAWLLQREECRGLLEERDTGGLSALSVAARFGSSNCMAELLKAGARVLERDGSCAALAQAAMRGNAHIVVRLLKESPGLVHTRPWGAMSALCWAATSGHAECVSLLLGAGADPNEHVVLGSKGGSSSGIGPAVEEVVVDGDTPLLLASRLGHKSCVWLLRQAGADLLATNSRGQTAVSAAKNHDVLRALDVHVETSPEAAEVAALQDANSGRSVSPSYYRSESEPALPPASTTGPEEAEASNSSAGTKPPAGKRRLSDLLASTLFRK